VLNKGSVPCESEYESRNENIENEDEKLSKHIGSGLGFGNAIKDCHFIK